MRRNFDHQHTFNIDIVEPKIQVRMRGAAEVSLPARPQRINDSQMEENGPINWTPFECKCVDVN